MWEKDYLYSCDKCGVMFWDTEAGVHRERQYCEEHAEPVQHTIPTPMLLKLVQEHNLEIEVTDIDNINRIRAIIALRTAKILD